MFLLVPAHPGRHGQGPESHKNGCSCSSSSIWSITLGTSLPYCWSKCKCSSAYRRAVYTAMMTKGLHTFTRLIVVCILCCIVLCFHCELFSILMYDRWPTLL